MSSFLGKSKRISIISTAKPITLQVNVATLLSFYIVERIQQSTFASIEYQVEQVTGRTNSILTAWTAVSLVDITDDTYSFSYTIATLPASGSTVSMKFRVVDTDGYKSFVVINDIIVVQ